MFVLTQSWWWVTVWRGCRRPRPLTCAQECVLSGWNLWAERTQIKPSENALGNCESVRFYCVCLDVCINRPATCLMRWTTSSSVGVVTGLRVSSRRAVRRCVRGLFLLLRMFFNALALGDGLWDSIWASSIFANSTSDKTTVFWFNMVLNIFTSKITKRVNGWA